MLYQLSYIRIAGTEGIIAQKLSSGKHGLFPLGERELSDTGNIHYMAYWGGRQELNLYPADPQSAALPLSYGRHVFGDDNPTIQR